MNIEPTQSDATLLNSLLTFVPPNSPAKAAQELGMLACLVEENDYLPQLTGFTQERIVEILAAARSWVLVSQDADDSHPMEIEEPDVHSPRAKRHSD